jgi:malonyl-CoA O-methyltransferase
VRAHLSVSGAAKEVSPEEGFRRWAPTYEAETALSVLESRLVDTLGIETSGRRILDAACGTGRRMVGERDAALSVGVDLVKEMLLAGRGPTDLRLVQGDLTRIPLRSASFDVVWCRLAIGFVDDVDRAIAELSRVTRPSGTVVVTDLHSDLGVDAANRTFREADGTKWAVRNRLHGVAEQEAAARHAGLEVIERAELRVADEDRELFARFGGEKLHAGLVGRAVVLGLVLRKAADR